MLLFQRPMLKSKIVKKTLRLLALLFILMNIIAFIHAYKFTHFDTGIDKTKDPSQLTTLDKVAVLLTGINNSRPVNKSMPSQPYEIILLQSNKTIACWWIKKESAIGTVILFHGYGGDKSSLLEKSDIFLALGYNTLLVDFMGSGGSEGNQTTLGYKEAEQVKTAYDYIVQSGEKNIILFGTSMGAVAILKCINDYPVNPSGIIIECPFGSMYRTTCARFHIMRTPVFPMASLLVFWGGVQNGFWAFGHRPTEYAKAVKCNTLLLYGEMDNKVSREETDEIFNNIGGKKTFKTYPLAGHENYLIKYKEEWTSDISAFLKNPIETE